MRPLVIDGKWASLNGGGVGRITSHLVRMATARFGEEKVCVVTPAIGADAPSVGPAGCYVSLPWGAGSVRRNHLLYDQFWLARYLRRRGAPVFISPHVEHPWTSRVPLVAFVYDLSSLRKEPGVSWWNYGYYAANLRHAVARASVLVTISRRTEQDLRERWPRLAERLVTVEPAVAALDPGIRCTGPSADDYFLYTGGAHGRKCVDILLRAFQNARAGDGLRSELWLTGAREAYEHVFGERVRLDGGGVRFLGRCSDEELKAYYRKARAVIYLSSLEGYGLPVAEGLLAGVPVVCSGLELLRQEHGDAPFYVENDVEAVATAIWRLASDDIFCDAMATAAVNAGQKLRSSMQSLAGWSELFRRLEPL